MNSRLTSHAINQVYMTLSDKKETPPKSHSTCITHWDASHVIFNMEQLIAVLCRRRFSHAILGFYTQERHPIKKTIGSSKQNEFKKPIFHFENTFFDLLLSILNYMVQL